jgi:hypothetical protein
MAGARHLLGDRFPDDFAFTLTEEDSPKAVEMSILVVRAFVRLLRNLWHLLRAVSTTFRG